jgi:hypothetical protein
MEELRSPISKSIGVQQHPYQKEFDRQGIEAKRYL